ncbi:MAG: nucleotide exchange factor GrpE [Bacilli bacterium]
MKKEVNTTTDDKKKKVKSTIELEISEVEAMNKKLAESEEKALRMQAEMVNYRKRKDEETLKMLKYANEELVLEILPIIDNFERAIKSKPEDETYFEGIIMIHAALVKTLEKFDVKEIESLEKAFDPTYHQAVLTETDEKKEKEIITEVYQKGYMLKDKVIRPAMVKVNK